MRKRSMADFLDQLTDAALAVGAVVGSSGNGIRRRGMHHNRGSYRIEMRERTFIIEGQRHAHPNLCRGDENHQRRKDR